MRKPGTRSNATRSRRRQPSLLMAIAMPTCATWFPAAGSPSKRPGTPPGSFYSHDGRAYFLRFEMVAQAGTAVQNFRRRLLGRQP